jgi:hypothetical protein
MTQCEHTVHKSGARTERLPQYLLTNLNSYDEPTDSVQTR